MARVLLLQADPLVIHEVQDALKGEGHDVVVTRDGLEGLASVERQKPDLLICDLCMPRLDGISLLQALAARDDTREIPVLFLSSVADPEAMLSTLGAGARAYLTVPLEREELVFHLKRLLPP